MNFDLIKKMEAVEIKADNRISDADRRCCEAHQQAYHKAKTALEQMAAQWKDIFQQQREILEPFTEEKYAQDKYVKIAHISSDDFKEKINELPAAFIDQLVGYFNRTYRVSINTCTIKEVLLPQRPDRYSYDSYKEAEKEYERRMKELLLTYKEVLEQIFIQLEGRTFAERALDEIKENCHTAAWNTYNGKAEFEVKNDTIRFAGYFCSFDQWLSREKWSVTDSMKSILRGLSAFETGMVGSYPQNIALLLSYDDKNFSACDFTDCTKVSQLRMFKNHRVDIKFANKEFAEQFVDEYLGRIC